MEYYIIESVECIGNGGFGLVEKVKVFNLSKTNFTIYAKKTILSDASNEDILRFKREVKHQAACSHDNIVPIILHDLKTQNPWFVMPLAENNLYKDIQENCLNDMQKIEIYTMIIDAIIYIHNKDLLHRDIKPQNILKYGNLYKLADFGLVKSLHPSDDSVNLTMIGTVMGSEDYMAPEIRVGGDYSKQSDIYAMGILLRDLSLDERFGFIIDKATSYRKSSRYKSITELKDDFLLAVSKR
jgi:hypothetical protein